MEASGRQCRPLATVGWLGLGVLWLLVSISGCTCAGDKTPVRNIPRKMKGVSPTPSPSSPRMRLRQSRHDVVMDNGFMQVTISLPGGNVAGIKYNGIDNVLEADHDNDNRGYWDVVWNKPGEHDIRIDRLTCTKFRIIAEEEDQLEVSFTKTWNASDETSRTRAPLNVDKRFIMLRGYSGLYTYAIFERLEGWPDVDMDQIRAVFKLKEKKFRYMSVSDERQRVMPSAEDRRKGQKLAYPEAVLLTNPSNSMLRGEVDDKYQYSSEDKDNRVHGWICADPPVGFWMITPSDEFRTAGPIKQDLTSHAGPTTLSMFVSTHYAGKDVGMKFRDGEPWKKVFGPVFVYLNSGQSKAEPLQLWEDAKRQMHAEVESWPYNFPRSEDYPKSYQRGRVDGQLLIRDRYMNKRLLWGDSAYVGLAAPGEPGSWQRESKSYQFWTRADRTGRFSINNVRPGHYNLYAWVPGVIGDYKYNLNITVRSGRTLKLRYLLYSPPRNGPTLWEIGVPDRSAAEFYIPDPYPTLMNQLYVNHRDKFRQYGLWERYSDLYPENDLVYEIGANDYAKDWFFAQVTRNMGNKTFEPTTWQIKFDLDKIYDNSTYTLRLALASATESDLQVRVNNLGAERPDFSTGMIGRDNAIARHGIHGLYWLFQVDIPSSRLVNGSNTIFLTQAKHMTPFQGVMYDYIRFEGPPNT